MKTINKQTFKNNYIKLFKSKNKRITKFNINNYNSVHIYYYNNFVYYRDVNNNIYLRFNGLDEFINFVINNNDINYKVVDNKNIINFYCLEHPEIRGNYFLYDYSTKSFI